MSALSINLVMEQGVDFDNSFTILNSDGTPLNLLGYTGVCSMKKSHTSSESAIPITLSFLNRAAGVVGISMSGEDTANILARRYVYDIKLISPNNYKTRPVEGLLEVRPGVS